MLRALDTTIDYERERSRSYYGEARYDPQRQAHRYEVTSGGLRVGFPVGRGSIAATLGSYRTRAGTVRVQATWAFDPDDRLLDVFVGKKWLYTPRHPLPNPE